MLCLAGSLLGASWSSGSSAARDHEPETGLVHAWVYFRDKGPQSIAKPDAAHTLISERSLRRRLKVREPQRVIDAGDLRLEPSYVQAVAARVQRLRLRSKWLNAVSVDATPAQLSALRALPCVRGIRSLARRVPVPASRIEAMALGETPQPPDSRVMENPPLYAYGSSFNQLQQIGVIDLHNMGLTGSGVLIAHFDNGYRQLAHESMSSLRIHATWDFVLDEENPDPAPCPVGQVCSSHGLETLSILAGYAPGKLIGPAFAADFLLVRTENEAIETPFEEDLWVAAAEWADSMGADVVSSSVGYRTFDDPQLDHGWEEMDGNTLAITRAADMAVARGIVVVNAVGNDGLFTAPNTLYAPSDGDSVISVGAVDRNGVHSILSSYGPTADGRTKPDVLAEGIGTFMAQANNPMLYGTGSGTSAACPLVAGVAALLISAFPDATPVQIGDALRSTASRASAPDRFQGWGLVDALAAYRALRDLGPEPPPFGGRTARIVPNPYPLAPSTPIRIELSAPAQVSLHLFDVRGRLVRALLSEQLPANTHTIEWNGMDDSGHGVASGAYYLRLQAAFLDQSGQVERETRKLIVLK
ncbi:MAG TPA: S8 family serine peptidase [Candidatus Krumholzibacteria bacterium]|nr:S8 family serine peptidase [Candidatus Krumholzibacteria bacterium]